MSAMTSLIAIFLTLFTTTSFAQEVRQTPLSPDHPLLGTWRVDLPNGCFDEYVLRIDGIKLSRSAAEQEESVFEISERPSPKGFYRWADKVTKTNGKLDCVGMATPIGDVAVSFILLDGAKRSFLLCEAESRASCFLRFYKVERRPEHTSLSLGQSVAASDDFKVPR